MTAVEQCGRRTEAFQRHIVPELAVLRRVALRLTRSHPDAEDLVQDTLFRAYRAVDRFDGAHPRAWLLTIMRNAHRNSGRRRRPGLLDDEDEALGRLLARGADGREGPAESVTEALPDRALVEALQRLPAAQRAVIALVDIDGLSYREAAERLGVPTGTVTSRLHRARRRVRDAMSRGSSSAAAGRPRA